MRRLDHIDQAINAATKNGTIRIVTILGELSFDGDVEQPFVYMIPADDAA